MTDATSPYACTLSTDGARARLPQARDLVSRLRHRERVDDRLDLTFRRDERTPGLVDDFVRDESQCCSFFGFTVRHEDDDVVLELSAPQDAGRMLDAVMAAFAPDLSDDERFRGNAPHLTD